MQELVFQPIMIADKGLFDRCFEAAQPEIAEFTFTNLFVWRNAGDLKFARAGDGIVVLFDHRGEKYFLPPAGAGDTAAVVEALLGYADRNGFPFSMKRVPESCLPALKAAGLKASEDRDNADYVYAAEDLAHLKGRRYDGKRGLVRKFMKNHKHQYVRFTPQHKDCCLKLAEDWVRQRDGQNQDLMDEYNAIRDTILYSQELGITGGFIRSEDRTVAFTFGEPLNRDTFVVHFEKADPAFNGAYQAINQLFVQAEVLGKYAFINREQDVGIESIRKAKLSYQPVRLVKKFVITR